MLLLTETNVPHDENISYFGSGDEAHMVYQFSLPPLLLHTLHEGCSRTLTDWAASLAPPPAGCTFLNFTASHDGVGVRPLEGLVSDDAIGRLVDGIRARGGLVSSREGPDGADSPYELNISYFDALGDPGGTRGTPPHVQRFLCSQSIALAMQGVPAMYLHSLTATANDLAAVERTGHNRAINRSRWDANRLRKQLRTPTSTTARVFSEYTRRLRIRREQPSFHPRGPQRIHDLGDSVFAVERTAPDGDQAVLAVSNVGPETVEIDVPAPSGGLAAWQRDLLARGDIETAPTTPVRLEPYQTAWYLATAKGEGAA